MLDWTLSLEFEISTININLRSSFIQTRQTEGTRIVLKSKGIRIGLLTGSNRSLESVRVRCVLVVIRNDSLVGRRFCANESFDFIVLEIFFSGFFSLKKKNINTLVARLPRRLLIEISKAKIRPACAGARWGYEGTKDDDCRVDSVSRAVRRIALRAQRYRRQHRAAPRLE